MLVKTLRPGLMVRLNTSVTGNARYRTTTIKAPRVDKDGARRSTWQTDKTIILAAEHDEAIRKRSRIRTIMLAQLVESNFGYLCPKANREKLDAAIEEATQIAVEFNRRAQLTRINFYVLVGEVASDDLQAIRGINAEMRSLLTDMDEGLRKLDVAAVRKAANDAKQLAEMLSDSAKAKVQKAIDIARKTARRIAKAGEVAAMEIDAQTLRIIEEGRKLFIDLDEPEDMVAPSVEDTDSKAIDLVPEESMAVPGTASRVLDFA
jgi:hypothetical protein